MGRGLAQLLATRLLHAMRGEHETISMHLPLSYLDLEIGDVIRFDQLLWRITELTHGNVLELNGVRHQPQIFSSYRILEEEADTASANGQIARPELRLLELPAPALRYHAGAGAAPLVAAFAAPWPQSVQLRREGALALSVDAPSLMGELVTDLPALSAAPIGRWDRHSEVDIMLYGGTIAALPESEVLAGGNRLAVETDTGWEVVQFARAELIGERQYRLSHLLRGQFGSDDAHDAHDAHDAGAASPTPARCIILGSAQTPLAAALDHLPQSLAFRFGPPNLLQDGYGWQEGRYDIRRTALACLSPVHARLDWPRGFADDWRIGWTRRSRLGGDDFAAGNVPLGEAREAYRLTLSADDAVVAQWQSEVSETLLTAQQRTNYHNRHNNSQNWQLAIQQINDRGEAGAPCHLSLPINEAF